MQQYSTVQIVDRSNRGSGSSKEDFVETLPFSRDRRRAELENICTADTKGCCANALSALIFSLRYSHLRVHLFLSVRIARRSTLGSPRKNSVLRTQSFRTGHLETRAHRQPGKCQSCFRTVCGILNHGLRVPAGIWLDQKLRPFISAFGTKKHSQTRKQSYSVPFVLSWLWSALSLRWDKLSEFISFKCRICS